MNQRLLALLSSNLFMFIVGFIIGCLISKRKVEDNTLLEVNELDIEDCSIKNFANL